MAKMTMKELVQSENAIAMLTSGVMWEFDFSYKLRSEVKKAKELIDGFHDHHLAIIKANGGIDYKNPQTGKVSWYIPAPKPLDLDEKASKEEVEKADASYQLEVVEYAKVQKAAEDAFNKLNAKEMSFDVNKIPMGEFKENFVAYLIPELKGKKFGLSIEDMDSLEWLIIYSKKSK